MATSIIWYTLGFIAVFFLVLSGFHIGRKQIWGGLVYGIIVGLVVVIINLIIGNGFNWEVALKIIIVGVLAGSFFYVIDWMIFRNNKLKKKRKK